MAEPATRSNTVADAAEGGWALLGRIFDATEDAPGVTRVAWGEGEETAMKLTAEMAMGFGAEQAFDYGGNQYLTLPGKDRSKRIVIGSHMDSVPHGGNYDGAAGVALGVALQQYYVNAGITPDFDLTVLCIRGEESCWFPYSYTGSRTAAGTLDPEVLSSVRRSDTGRTLGEHMDELGFDQKAVAEGKTWLTLDDVLAYVEVHIEQAPALLAEGLPLGIVTGIRGSFRYRDAVCTGEYSHSGAMPRKLRRDAVQATAKLIGAAGEIWDRVEAEGGDLVITFGKLGTDPEQHSFSKVSGHVDICLDVRSKDEDTLARVDAELRDTAEKIGAEFGCTFDWGPKTGSTPALMAPGLVEMMTEAATAGGIETMLMASGAGHDAATFSLAGVPTGLMFMRNENGSHNPEEHLEAEDFHTALAALVELFALPADRWLALR